MLITSALSLVQPSILGHLVQHLSEVVGEQNLAREGFNRILLVLVGVVILRGAVTGIRRFLFVTAGERMVTQLKKDLFQAIISREIPFFDASNTGELVSRITDDTTKLRTTMSRNFPDVLRASTIVAGGMVYLFMMSWKLTLLSAAVIPPVVVTLKRYGNNVKKMGKAVQQELAESTSVATEALGNIRTVRAFVKENDVCAVYNGWMDASYVARREWALSSAVFQSSTQFFAGLAMCLMIWMGGSLVYDGDLTIGKLTAYLFYTVTIGQEMALLAGLYTDVMGAMGSSESVFDLLNKYKDPGGRKFQGPLECIRFDKVSFRYPGRPLHAVLTQFTMTLLPGRMVALVGPSGGGKSTVVALLMGFYPPSKGVVFWNDTPANEVDPRELRRHTGLVAQVGYCQLFTELCQLFTESCQLFTESYQLFTESCQLFTESCQLFTESYQLFTESCQLFTESCHLFTELFQEPVLFSATIEENIAYAADADNVPSREQVERAARLASAHAFIEHFPDGYETVVGERGVKLSGGQRQRVSQEGVRRGSVFFN
jgi:ATP-binding cassette subfamily B protein